MPNCNKKKHASDLSPYPLELIPFKLVKGSDTQYGQFHKPIQAGPYKEARIEGFKPLLSFNVPANYLTTDTALAFHWPSLLELNNKIVLFQSSSEDERRLYLSGDTVLTLPLMYTGPPPTAPTYPLPAIPELTILTRSIIQSFDQLFFISHSVGSNKARKWRLVQVAFKESMSFIPIMSAGWLLPSQLLHLPF
jgi:hypothetical protein